MALLSIETQPELDVLVKIYQGSIIRLRFQNDHACHRDATKA
jgi:hypothetical protein